jgi:hypothetical protein
MAISPDDAAKLTGYFEAADAARTEAERKWGVGRLEILCGQIDASLLARFRGQQARWRKALEACWKSEFLTVATLGEVEKKTGAMQRAWAALDDAAEAAGHRPVAPWVWEVRLADGSIAALVQSDAEASKVIAEGRYLRVYTAAEIGNVIDSIPASLQAAKTEFPGAKVLKPNPYRRSGNEIPFDDPIPFGGQQEEEWE